MLRFEGGPGARGDKEKIYFLKTCLPSALPLALGKDLICRVPAEALGKIILFFGFLDPNFFVQSYYNTYNTMFKFGIILRFLAVFS